MNTRLSKQQWQIRNRCSRVVGWALTVLRHFWAIKPR